MRRRLSLLLAVLLLLPGCGKTQDETTSQDAETIVQVMLAMIDEQDEADSLTWVLEREEVSRYLADFYRLEGLDWSDGAVARMEGARAFELAVLFVDETDVEGAAKALQQYLLDRKGAFTGYFPEQADMADRGLVLTKGQCVALIVCQDPDQAEMAFETCFGEGVNARGIPAILGPGPEDLRPDGRLIYVDPKTDDMTLFDSSAILEAWRSGDDSSLSPKDRQVLEAARAVFDQCVTSGMTDYDKEAALYFWLATHVRYDQSHYSDKGAPRTAYEPYGALIDGKAVCLGFATTFQLFMDMAEVECIIVTGAAFMNRGNHAWNMVKLDGEWYCTDVTWDLFGEIIGDNPMGPFSYFNVTSDYMALTDHQWDYDNTPEATAEDHGRP